MLLGKIRSSMSLKVLREQTLFIHASLVPGHMASYQSLI